MPEERAQRRLAAILAADVVGYSRLMGVSEVGTLEALKTHRRNREKFTLECAFLAKEKQVVRLKSPREVERFVTAA